MRPSALGLMVASALLYFWNLTNSGWANEFYAAAVQAGSLPAALFESGFAASLQHAVTGRLPPAEAPQGHETRPRV